VADEGHETGASTVTDCLIEPSIEITAFLPLTLDVKARQTDNIRTITTAAILLPASRFKSVFPQERRKLTLANDSL
jgi:hypothetical protein